MRHRPTRTLAVVCASPLAALFCFLLLSAAPRALHAQPSKTTVSAMLISDVHFEPFWDPDKVAQLIKAPITSWNGILASKTSPNRKQEWAKLASCARGSDTNYWLLDSSLNYIRTQTAGINFITVSGDLISHGFDCKYRRLTGSMTGYATFAENTIEYVVMELNTIAPGVPVYVGLGNNDSGCGDYELNKDDPFFKAIGTEITDDVPSSDRKAAFDSFNIRGSYRVQLPSPIQHTRLLVLEDIFMSAGYHTCGGKPGVDDAMNWLKSELDKARVDKEKVWVMAHIPTGIDAYNTLAGKYASCKSPTTFLKEELTQGQPAVDPLGKLLTEESDVISVALFAHTHMDEIKLLSPSGNTNVAGGIAPLPGPVAVKVLPSISPVNGNHPTFTIAQIDPANGDLVNYQVYSSSDSTPTGKWSQEYDYFADYGEPSFTPSTLSDLIKGFAKSPTAKPNYIHHFEAGTPTPFIALVWPQYVCTLTQDTSDSFTSCACPNTSQSATR